MDLGFLGDTVHMIPAYRIIRCAYPTAHLCVWVAEHVQEILQACPWIDEVVGYPRYPKAPSWLKHGPWFRRLRMEAYDAVINLTGSDRSSYLTWLTRSSHRLGRRPDDGGHWLWNRLHTHVVEMPRGKIPFYQQQCECLAQAGFPNAAAHFDISLPEKTVSLMDALLPKRLFLHVSPLANDDYKMLPLPVVASVLSRLRVRYPEMGLVISCAASKRERHQLKKLLELLDFSPEVIFDGNLTVLELAAVMLRCRLHLGGDSGGLHVAVMAGASTVSWFREYAAMDEWRPFGLGHASLVGKATPMGLAGITAEQVEQAAVSLLDLDRDHAA